MILELWTVGCLFKHKAHFNDLYKQSFKPEEKTAAESLNVGSAKHHQQVCTSPSYKLGFVLQEPAGICCLIGMQSCSDSQTLKVGFTHVTALILQVCAPHKLRLV